MARGWVGIADLLQTRNQFKHVLDARFGAKGLQIDNALVLGPVVTFLLPGVQGNEHLRHLLGRQVIQDITLFAPELQLPVAVQQFEPRPVLSGRREAHMVYKFEDGSQLLFIILKRRSGQRPGASSLQALQGTTGCVPVLDSLRLVGNHHIPDFSPQRRSFVAAIIRPQGLITHQRHVYPCLPLPCTIGNGTPYDDGAKLRRPFFKLSPPLVQKACRSHHQYGLNQSLRTENSRRDDGLKRLAESHVVGQQDSITVDQSPHPFLLEGHELTRPFQGGIGLQQQGF